uniref:Uncharacterized protein n=1 Tax=Palpitomonas bilix TaxID=652834 RepID=A0A7S3G599_9EUKA|mmetsp:Transcript_26760/g.68800  ORF Transcript_26760/g.68800 Transcript_26760/m.68800 type:complete len:252 (+) Transcript_26760:159-914(+)
MLLRKPKRENELESNKALFVLGGLFSLAVAGLVFYIYISHQECAESSTSIEGQLAEKVLLLDRANEQVDELAKVVADLRERTLALEKENIEKDHKIFKQEVEAQEECNSYQRKLGLKDSAIKSKEAELKEMSKTVEEAEKKLAKTVEESGKKLAAMEEKLKAADAGKGSCKSEVASAKSELEECKKSNEELKKSAAEANSKKKKAVAEIVKLKEEYKKRLAAAGQALGVPTVVDDVEDAPPKGGKKPAAKA